MKSRKALVGSEKPKIIIIAGPTASGKTALSLELAHELNGEIVNIDSVQIFKHFNIGSAKLPVDQRQGITHHLIDIIEPNETFNVASYKRLADELILDISSRGKTPIFVGGSSLYIKVLLHGLTTEMGSDLELRDKLELEELQKLVADLIKLDPELSKTIDLQNKRRVVRALESISCNQTSVSLAQNNHHFKSIDYQALIVLLEANRAALYQKINLRAEEMIQAGLIEETKNILNNFGENCSGLKSLGYRETMKYIAGELTLNELPELIAQNTRRFAKKQLTFWRNEPKKRNWVEIKNNSENPESLLHNLASNEEYQVFIKAKSLEISNIFNDLGDINEIQVKILKAQV